MLGLVELWWKSCRLDACPSKHFYELRVARHAESLPSRVIDDIGSLDLLTYCHWRQSTCFDTVVFLSAWVPEESLWSYEEHRERFMPTQRVPQGFQHAVDAIELLVKKPSASSSVRCLHVLMVFLMHFAVWFTLYNVDLCGSSVSACIMSVYSAVRGQWTTETSVLSCISWLTQTRAKRAQIFGDIQMERGHPGAFLRLSGGVGLRIFGLRLPLHYMSQVPKPWETSGHNSKGKWRLFDSSVWCDISISHAVPPSNVKDPLQTPLVQCICLLYICLVDHPPGTPAKHCGSTCRKTH